MHTPEKAKYPQLTLIEVLSNFLKLKQGDNETLLDYYSRFKSEKNVVENLIGKGLMDVYTESTDEYKVLPAGAIIGVETSEQKEVKKKNWERLIAVLFLRNAEHGRYNELLIDYRKAFANKECKYPQNITDMIDVMRQQPGKRKPRPKENNNRDKDKDQREKDESKEDVPASSFAQTKGTMPVKKKIACFCCGDEECLLN